MACDRDRRPAGPARDVGDTTPAASKLVGDVGQGPDPLAHQMVELRSIDAFLRFDDVRAVIGPVDAAAGPVGIEQAGHGRRRADHEPRERREEPWALGIGQDGSVAGRQRVAPLVGRGGHVVDIEDGADGLMLQPLTCIAGIDAGALRQLRSGRRAALFERSIQTKPVADVDGLEVECGEHRAGEPAGELVAMRVAGVVSGLIAGVVDRGGHIPPSW